MSPRNEILVIMIDNKLIFKRRLKMIGKKSNQKLGALTEIISHLFQGKTLIKTLKKS